MICASCDRENPPQAKFCRRCGNSFSASNEHSRAFCSQCGNQATQKAKYCAKCGHSLFKRKTVSTRLVGQLQRGIQEFNSLGWSVAFPFKELLAYKPWNLVWVRWFGFLALFPLFLDLGASGPKVQLKDIAFFFATYFALIWGLVLHSIIKPARTSKGELLAVAGFTFFIAAMIAGLIEHMFKAIFGLIVIVPGGILAFFVVGVGLVEEIAKASPLLWLYLKKKKPDSVRTVIFLGCVSGLAFGAVEAVAYSLGYATYLRSGEISLGQYWLAQLARLISLPLLHALFTGIAAYYIGIGVHHKRVQKGLLLAGIGFTATLHGLYDALSAAGSSLAAFGLAVFALLIFIAYLGNIETVQEKIQNIDIKGLPLYEVPPAPLQENVVAGTP